MKRIISTMLALVLVLSVLGVGVTAIQTPWPPPTHHVFPTAIVGYGVQTPLRNRAGEVATITQFSLSGENPSAFQFGAPFGWGGPGEDFMLSWGYRHFYVRPVVGLEPGIYTATVTISQLLVAVASFDVSFTVVVCLEDPNANECNCVTRVALNNLYIRAIFIRRVNYTTASWRALQTAINNAQAVLNNENAAQVQVNVAFHALQSAMNGLQECEATGNLLEFLPIAMIVPNTGFTPASWNAFQLAIYNAQAVLDDVNATSEQVQQRLDELTSAGGQLDDPGNKTDLASWLIFLQQITRSNFSHASWNALHTVIGQAQTIMDDPNATQEQVDTILEALISAYNDLVHCDLYVLLAQARTHAQHRYTEESWNALQTAITNAQTIWNDLNATPAQIDEQLAALQLEIDGLEIRVWLILYVPLGNLHFLPGQTRQFSYIFEPADAQHRSVTWASDNPSVATVTADGLVTAVTPGNVTITATTECGIQNFIPLRVSRTIFGTSWEANFLNWLLFFFGFGWLWMWF